MITCIQVRLQKDVKLKKPYSYGPYNVVRGDKQAIRITEGCVNNCPQCYEPTELKVFGIPEIVRNHVLIYDMNLLCKPEALDLLKQLGRVRVFMVTNYLVSFEECCQKLDLCKVWNVQVVDCYFDGQVMPHVVPIFWTSEEIKVFRRKVRKHNMLVGFWCDPEVLG